MIIFGIDVPLVEILFTLTIIMFILFIESIIVVILMFRQMNKTKKLSETIQSISETLLEIKKAEVQQMSRRK